MLELLSRAGALILKNTYVFETAVSLEVLNPLCDQSQKLLDLAVAGHPQMLVMAGGFEQQLVRTDRSHPGIQAVTSTGGLAFNPKKRGGGKYRPGRPFASSPAR